MEVMTLVELYLQKAPSGISAREVELEIVHLTGTGWLGEQIFFSINYLAEHYPEELKKGLLVSMSWNKSELLKYYHLAKIKKTIKQAEEGETEYVPENNVQGTDPPKWFRKGIDFNLFK